MKCKVVLCGDTNVGKTSLMRAFMGQPFKTPEVTIAAAFTTKEVVVGPNTVTLGLWDTAGQERFRGLAPIYFRQANGIIVVFDATDEVTFANACEKWIPMARANTGLEDEHVCVVLVANKVDLPNADASLLRRARDFTDNSRISYFETSAATGRNIDALFQSVARDAATRRLAAGPIKDSVQPEAGGATPPAGAPAGICGGGC